ncbi:MAG: CRISPR-associated protein Csx20 [Treponema sp.]|nr:CRISPR-associated protein Csx20 [Treponema sp.]
MSNDVCMSAFCLLNHRLTPRQETELKSILYPPPHVADMWSRIPTDRELKKAQLEPFATWLQEAETGDIVVLQGEFSATFAMVDFVLGKGLIPVCAVTERVAQEEREGEIVHRKYVFEHICFRRYRHYRDLI